MLFISPGIKSQKIYCQPMSDPMECMLLYLAVKEFIGDTSVTIIFNPYEPLDDSFNGLTWKYNKKMYLISISSKLENPFKRIWTIFHETGHIIDMYNGALNPEKLEWQGIPISNQIPWADRPWEQSAENWADLIWKKLMQ